MLLFLKVTELARPIMGALLTRETPPRLDDNEFEAKTVGFIQPPAGLHNLHSLVLYLSTLSFIANYSRLDSIPSALSSWRCQMSRVGWVVSLNYLSHLIRPLHPGLHLCAKHFRLGLVFPVFTFLPSMT